ncbi:MAG: PilZ domain-containing protein [Deltaproteobacteria bacterium]|nr:PilZ domain-containing protein [Deltaproteobacteria bacterium]
MENKFTELSRAERVELQILGKLTIEKSAGPSESFLCNTLNISTSGALIETGSMISIGSLLRYSVSFPGFDRTFDITGEVVRGERKEKAASDSDSEPRKLIRYGIMFLDLSEDDRKAIESFFLQTRLGGQSESAGHSPACMTRKDLCDG